MSIIGLIVILIIVGVLLWALNTLLGDYIAAPILKVINVVVIVAVVLYVLVWFLGMIGMTGVLSFPKGR